MTFSIRKTQDRYSGNDIWGLEDDGVMLDIFTNEEEAREALDGFVNCTHRGFMTISTTMNTNGMFIIYPECEYCGASTELRYQVSDIDLAR